MPKDYSGTPRSKMSTSDQYLTLNVSRTDNGDGKRIEITDSNDFGETRFRVTLTLTRDDAIRLAIRLFPQDTMIRVVEMLSEEDPCTTNQ